MEFGIVPGGEASHLILGDEVLTPDCSRYWPSDGYEPGRDQPSFDKQYVRDWLKRANFDKKTPLALPAEVVAATIEKYVTIFNRLTGAPPKL